MNPSNGKSQQILSDVGTEMKSNPPGILAKTAAKYGSQRAQAQRVAILLSKARKMGAKVPQPKNSSAGKSFSSPRGGY